MISLSASKLGILKECPRCFWDANNLKFARPRGIFSSLPNGIDLIMKDYFDQFRGSLPPELEGKVDGVLMPDIGTLEKWRHWQTGLTWKDTILDVKLIGALDDCLVDGEFYTPLDNKTKGKEPEDDGSQYYQLQLDCYTLLLETNFYKTKNKAYLNYYYPLKIMPAANLQAEGKRIILPWSNKVFELAANPDRAIEKIKEAVTILKGKRPEPAPSCEYCKFGLFYQRG